MVQWFKLGVGSGLESMQLILEILIFGFSLWMGFYLINRNLSDSRMLLAGAGLVAYSAGLGLDTLIAHAQEPELGTKLNTWQQTFLFLSALFWLALLVRLLIDQTPIRDQLKRHPKPFGVILAATLFFALGIGLLIFPLDRLPRIWVLVGIGLDLILLGLAVAVLDAFDEGEALLPDFLRSLDYSFFTALLFGGQVALAMVFSTGITIPMLILLLATISAAMLIQTFSNTFQSLLDRIAFLYFPSIRQARSELQTAARATTRMNRSLDPDTMDEEEFTRLTRRALSYMGNLPKLAASPLTQLKIIENRLAQNGNPVGILDQANELKIILGETIDRLKPTGQDDFGTADEWRFYNALYFPYVRGLKPYSRRKTMDDLDDASRQALNWFRTEIPQRTLHNWQNAAAKLVAQDLRERSKMLNSL